MESCVIQVKETELFTLKKEIMKIKFIALSLCMLAGISLVNGQNSSKKTFCPEKRHEVRLSVSDGLTSGNANILGLGLSDALTGMKRTDERSSLGYGLGYRYSINRFRFGGDLGFSQLTSKLTLTGEKTPSIKEKEWNMLFLPTAEFIYYKKGLFELYGAASAGVSLNHHSEKGLTMSGMSAAKKSSFSALFAYQVNPLAVRVGNDRIGGFVEAGLGHKGFVTAGVSLRF